jgi:methionyl-tRNA formyltransferase
VNQNNIKIAFLGTPKFAASILEDLVKAGFNIVGVYTKPDTTSGRNKKPKISEVKEAALKYNLPVFQPVNKLELEVLIIKSKPDLLVVAAYGLILTTKTLEAPKYGALNVHGSLLPKYRGASPVASAILNGEQKTGISIIKVTPGMDEGPILQISPHEAQIEPDDTTESLMDKMATLGSEAIIEAIPKYIQDEVELIEQIGPDATYCKMIAKEDGVIDFNKSASQIEKEVRAYYPWPKSQLIYKNKKYIILKALVSDLTIEPGIIKNIDNKLILGLKDSSLEILLIQPEGKKPMKAKDFLNGYNI